MFVKLALSTLMFSSAMAFAVEPTINCGAPDVFCTEEFMDMTRQATSIESVVDRLPQHLKRNVTFKRGNNIEKRLVGKLGPHGHKVSSASSESASPSQPRAFVWDELTGFTASWNSGNPLHTAHERVDLYDFDFKTNQHRLFAWNPSEGGKIQGPEFVDKIGGQSCIQCHGQVQRPIFPMYPDWPQFYGEFNDEMSGYPKDALALRADLKIMANEFQPKERAQYFDFLKGEAQSNPRYSPLLAAKAKSDGNPYYPYRPRATVQPFSDESRAFHFRPNLRLGVLYNRLTALQTFEKIKASPIFKKFPDVVFYSLLDCNWDINQTERVQILGTVLDEAKTLGLSNLTLRGQSFSPSEVQGLEKSFFKGDDGGYYPQRSYTDKGYAQIPYEDLLKLLSLDVRDLDIRFKHDSGLKVNKGFGVYDPKAFYFTDSAMDIGYVETFYKLNPICDNKNNRCKFSYDGTYMHGARYFNSYFDGSATTNELIAAQMLLYLTDKTQNFSNEPALNQVRASLRQRVPNPNIYFETLMNKYARFTDRLVLDGEFFNKMDTIGPWIQLPYQPDLLNVHNRESFWGSSAKTRGIRLRHAQWDTFEDRQKGRKNLNGGNNICWNVYDSLQRFRK